MSITWARRRPRGRQRGTARGLAVALVLAVAVSGCGGSSSGSSSSGDAILTVGVSGLPKLLVPSGSTAADDLQMVDQVYDGLVTLDAETKEVAPALATSWTVSDDGLRYEFELREGVEFQDGTLFDAEVVALNYARLADPDSEYYWPVGAGVAEGAIFGNVSGVEVISPEKVAFDLKKPDPDWPSRMATAYAHIISGAVIKEYAPDEVTQHPIGTGPFEVDTRNASAVTFKRNPTYWGDAPEIDGFVIRAYPDNSPRVAALNAGEVDVVFEVNPDSIENRDEERLKAFTWGIEVPWMIRLNTRNEFMGDELVRQALNHAVDKQGIADALWSGLAEVSTQPFQQSHVGYNPDATGYDYDPDRAKDLLAEAGYPDGFSIKAIVPTEGLQQVGPLTQAVQADLREVGVDLEFESLEWTSYLEKIAPGLTEEYAISVTEWADQNLSWLRQQLGSDRMPPAGSNLGWYSNPAADDLMDQADQPGVEPAERAAMYQEASKLMSEDAAWLFLVNRPTAGISTYEVNGIGYSPSGFDLSTVTIGDNRTE